MATRLLITDAQGVPMFAIDGHHGARHAAEWASGMMMQLTAAGVDAMLIELHPAQGADDFRRDTLEQIGRIRVEFHQRPDGLREVVSLARYPKRAGESVATQGVGRGLLKSAAAATATALVGGFRLVHAPADVHGDRHAVRVPRGRMNPTQEQPRTIGEMRQQRRLDRASQRGARTA
jgi:hypothetical protein